MPDYLIEVYMGMLHPHELETVARRARTAADAGIAVHYQGCIAIPEDETCFHLYSGPTAAAVTEAARRAAIAVERTVEAVHLQPDGTPTAVTHGPAGRPHEGGLR